MTNAYNGKLISNLYNLDDNDEIMKVLEEMEEIADAVFIYPIFDSYRKNYKEWYSHCFINSLSAIESPEILKVAKEILKMPNVKKGDIVYCIEIFHKERYFDSTILALAFDVIKEERDIWDLKVLIPYISDNNGPPLDLLVEIYKDQSVEMEAREYALMEWIKIDPNRLLGEIIDNFPTFSAEESFLVVLAKVIVRWKGGRAKNISDLIMSSNNLDAQHVIDADRKRKEKANGIRMENQQETIKREYSNADLIHAIIKKRKAINLIALSEDTIGIELFPANEELMLQTKSATDLSALQSNCVNLRSIIQDINKQTLAHGLDTEAIKLLVPGATPQDYKKSLIGLYLFLKSRGFQVEQDLGGIQPLNKLLNLLGAHPDDQIELNKILKTLGGYELYMAEDWTQLHQLILTKYEEGLDKLLSLLRSGSQ